MIPDEPLRLPQGLLCRLPQEVRGVPVHVHLAHKGPHPVFLQGPEEVVRSVVVDGGEEAGVEGAVAQQLPHQGTVHRLGVGRVAEVGLLGEGIALQPVEEQTVHPHAPLKKLGGVNVEVGEGRDDQAPPVVRHRQGGIGLRHLGPDAPHRAVLHRHIGVFMNAERLRALRVGDVPV